jgi:Short C-terminal domain
MRRSLAILGSMVVAIWGVPAAHAGALVARIPHKCLVANQFGQLPSCTRSGNGGWVATYPNSGPGGSSGGGIPSGFIALFVIVGLIGIGVTIWRISLTRRMATNAGVNPNDATALAVLGGSTAIDTAILAKTLSHRSNDAASPAAEEPHGATAEARLKELQHLKDNGVITADEYESRRAAIINAI